MAVTMLPAMTYAQTVDICDRPQELIDAFILELRHDDCATMPSVEELDLSRLQLTSLPVGAFRGFDHLRALDLGYNQFTSLPVGVFDGLGRLEILHLGFGQLTTLPVGVFNDLSNLESLQFTGNRLTSLPVGVFDGLVSLRTLLLNSNRLMSLPAGLFDSLSSLESLSLGTFELLHSNQLTSLPVRLFSPLEHLKSLDLSGNQLTSLPVDTFSGLANLEVLVLWRNRLSYLSVGVFDDLRSLKRLDLSENRLASLTLGVFDRLGNLERLWLSRNRLISLPSGVFDGLRRLRFLDLSHNHLVGLDLDDVLANQRGVDVRMDGQTQPEEPLSQLRATIPLLLSVSNANRQGFVRIINQSGDAGLAIIRAIDDAGNAHELDVTLEANQRFHFNSNDLQDGHRDKGIGTGIGAPEDGEWRLELESVLELDALAYVRTSDGFLTAMHDVLPRDAQGRLVAWTFNPASNVERQSRLRLMNWGRDPQRVVITGLDDMGNRAGPVTLTLSAGASRTLSAPDLEDGARDAEGTLGDGVGKWSLFIDAGASVVGMNLLYSVSGHVSNLSTANSDRPEAVRHAPSLRDAGRTGR